MTAHSNCSNVFTYRLIVVAKISVFVLCLILVLEAVAYLTQTRSQAATGLAVTDHTPSQGEVTMVQNDRLTRDPATETLANRLFDFTFTQIHMAMPIRITVWAKDERQARLAGRAAFKRISSLVQVLSNYEPESELNRLVAFDEIKSPGQPQRISSDLLAVLSYSKQLFQLTDGAFDPSAGPVIDLWKQARKEKTLPSRRELDHALGRVGFDQIEIDSDKREVRVLRSGVQLDLGAIAKGYIADEALEVIRNMGN